jgi:hypothetical protein
MLLFMFLFAEDGLGAASFFSIFAGGASKLSAFGFSISASR